MKFSTKQTKVYQKLDTKYCKKEPIVILITARHSLLKSASKSSKHGFHDDVSMDNFFIVDVIFCPMKSI